MFCTVLACLAILYLEKEPSHIDIVVSERLKYSESNQLLDLNKFAYVLNSVGCSNQTFGVLIVTSYAGDVEIRSAVRQAYPRKLLTQLGLKRVFLLAQIHPNKNVNNVEQAAIVNENDRFGDIVQGNFFEDYRNLTYKHVMGLRWASENCKNVSYVVKMDHDIVADLFSIVTMLKKLPKRDLMLAGYVMMNMKPIRDPANKWYVTEEEYHGERYPEFLSGWLYITNPYTAELLSKTSNSVSYFWIDDTYVTGLLAERLNLPLAKLNKYYTTHPEHLKCCMAKPKYQCDFWVGPNGGETKLVQNFEKYAEACYKYKCKKRLRGASVRDNCVVSWASDRYGRPLV